MSTTRLLVMAKSPLPGRSKTRLCPPCTPAEAARLAEAALADTLESVRAVSGIEPVVVLEGPPGPWLPACIRVIPQRGDGLDERLAAAFEDAGGPALLIGMDTPQASTALLEASIGRLWRRATDAVLGRAHDGGWWALGLRRPDPRLLLGVPMSTPWTGLAQALRLEAVGLRWRALRWLRDVDRFEDALAVASIIPRSRFAHVLAPIAANVAGRLPVDEPAGAGLLSVGT